MSIRKNNILLAEFMGEKVDDQGMGGYDISDLEYHESWDWLMPVVIKIESVCTLSKVKSMVSVSIADNDCRIEQDPQHAIAFKEEIEFEDIWEVKDTKMEAVYEAVIKFVIWINKNKSLRIN